MCHMRHYSLQANGKFYCDGEGRKVRNPRALIYAANKTFSLLERKRWKLKQIKRDTSQIDRYTYERRSLT